MKTFLKNITIALLVAAAVPAAAQEAADLSDTEIAHVAYTADTIDIRYAHLALAISDNSEVQAFAETMIRDHTAVNEQALALLDKLGVAAKDNFLSQSLNEGAAAKRDELAALQGDDFDKAYAQNELAYHQAVNDLVGEVFIPNIDNAEVKSLFEAGLEIFLAHQAHAEKMVENLK